MGQKKSIKGYKICIIGAGHVGLVAASCFAELGNMVVCVDSNKEKIASLKKSILPFYEPDLEPLVKKNVKRGNLTFCFSLNEGIKKSQVIFISVGTPSLPDGSADLSSIENIASLIAKNLNSYKLIIEKSTVPVQTGKKLKETICRYRKNNTDFDLASNPEFLREGKAIYDFFYPDRIIIGVESERAEKILKSIYAKIKAPIVVTDVATAELIKHASNSFLAAKISFINAVARVCDSSGADVKKVAQGMGLDRRIGKEFLAAGVGYGGSCFSKDLGAFRYISRKLNYEFDLLKEVKIINEGQKRYFVEKIKANLWVLKDKKIAILGLSFKPGTDDMRFAPSIDIVKLFIEEGARVSVYDPKAMKEAGRVLSALGKKSKVRFCKSSYQAVQRADCLCFLTQWDEFKKLDFKKVKKLMQYPLIADGRNMLDKGRLLKLGFEYIGIGR